MMSSKYLSTLGVAALCALAQTPALSQDSIPIFPIITFENTQVQSTLNNYGGAFADNGELANDSVTYGNSLLTTFASHEDPDSMQFVPGHDSSSMYAFK